MKIEVLLSTMNQKNFDIVKKCNIKGDVIVINQCNEEKVEEKYDNNGHIKMIYTMERGLSKSRNMALKEATGDICILCDDDIEYLDSYIEIVRKAFSEVKDADVIVFNVMSMNTEQRKQENLFSDVRRIPFYKSYGSVHIAFRRKSIQENCINFNVKFGSGSGMYSFAEDSLFFAEIHKKKLKSYVYPAVIANLYTEGSTWFSGFNEKYFYDMGAYLCCAYPYLRHIFKLYYLFRLRGEKTISPSKMIKWMNNGMKGYKRNESFNKFNKNNNLP